MRIGLLSLALVACAAGFATAPAPVPTPDIKVDQVGYLPEAPKVAMVVSNTPATSFVVRRAGEGTIAYRGTLSAPAADANSGDAVQAADFRPSLSQQGRYYLDVPGVGVSWPFAVGPECYAGAFYLALRSFYGQRCGTAVDLGPEFPGYAHDARQNA